MVYESKSSKPIFSNAGSNQSNHPCKLGKKPLLRHAISESRQGQMQIRVPVLSDGDDEDDAETGNNAQPLLNLNLSGNKFLQVASKTSVLHKSYPLAPDFNNNYYMLAGIAFSL